MGMSDLNERLNQLEQGALNLLFPRKCPFCNRHIGGRDLICGDCEKTLPYTGDRARRQVSGLRVAAPLYYEDAVRRGGIQRRVRCHHLGAGEPEASAQAGL